MNFSSLQKKNCELTSNFHPASPYTAALSEKTLSEIKQFIQLFFQVCHRSSYKKERAEQYFNNQRNFSVLMGYDFHITDSGVKLIEVNTNAAGALFGILDEYERFPQKSELYEKRIKKLAGSFIEDFTLWKEGAGIERELKTIAILDENVNEAYWNPEFKLYQSLFQEMGLKGIIADASEVKLEKNDLVVQGEKVDMVYNRYCDFYLKSEKAKLLHTAYTKNYACFSPNPFEYHLTANKDVLVLFSEEKNDNRWEISPSERKFFDSFIPKTYLLNSFHEEEIIRMRKKFFFKPRSHYGGKGVYRGDKITKKKIQEIENDDYLMQELTNPSTITVKEGDMEEVYKVDYRFFVYQGEVFHYSSRLYQGQVTNFRTKGGGFAPVIIKK